VVKEVVLRVSGNSHETFEEFSREITEVNQVKFSCSDLLIQEGATDFNRNGASLLCDPGHNGVGSTTTSVIGPLSIAI
jgi:hypothetical protein